MKAKSVIRKGPSSGRGNKTFIAVKEDEPVTIVPILPTEQIVSIDLHAFWTVNPAVTFACLDGTDEGCPGCELGDKAAYRAFLPVLDSEGDMKMFAFGISVERQLVTLEEELGEIVGLKLRVKRTGTGLATKYQVINTGKNTEVEVTEKEATKFVESNIDVKDRDTIESDLRAAGLLGGKSASKKAKDEDDETEEEEDEAPKKAAVKKGKPEAKPAKKGKKDDDWE
jgi:hypothetical protein